MLTTVEPMITASTVFGEEHPADVGDAHDGGPGDQRDPAAVAVDQPTGDRREQHHRQSGRHHRQTGRDDRQAEPVPGRRPAAAAAGWSAAGSRTSRSPTRTDAMLVSSTGRRPEVRRSTSGWPTLSSYGTQTTSTATVTTNRPIDLLAAPAPGAALGDAQQQRGQRDRQQHRAEVVEAALGAHGRLRHQRQHADDQQRRRCRRRSRRWPASRSARR